MTRADTFARIVQQLAAVYTVDTDQIALIRLVAEAKAALTTGGRR